MTLVITPNDYAILVALKKAYDEDEGIRFGMQRGWRYATDLGFDWQQIDAVPPTLIRTDVQPGRPTATVGNRQYRITDSGLAALAAYINQQQPVITESKPMTDTRIPTPKSLADFAAVLERPFALEEHGFVNRNPYIKKHPIRKRLSEADPNWTVSEPEIMVMTDEIVVMRGTITVNGVSRAGVGSATILRHQKVERKDQPDEYVPLNPVEQSRQVSRACKAAASDIIARAALEFGVGAYLKDKPSDRKINNMTDLEKWLKELSPTPKHWALNGKGETFNARRAELGLDMTTVMNHFGIKRLSEIKLTFEQAMERLESLAVAIFGAKPKQTAPAPAPTNAFIDIPHVSVKANTVQKGDVIAHVDGNKVIDFAIPLNPNESRVRYIQNGEAQEGVFSAIANVIITSGPSFDAATAAATPAS